MNEYYTYTCLKLSLKRGDAEMTSLIQKGLIVEWSYGDLKRYKIVDPQLFRQMEIEKAKMVLENGMKLFQHLNKIIELETARVF